LSEAKSVGRASLTINEPPDFEETSFLDLQTLYFGKPYPLYNFEPRLRLRLGRKKTLKLEGREMRKPIHFFFILTFLFSIGVFYHLSSKTVFGGDPDKKNPSSTKETNTLTWHKYDKGLAKAKKEKKHILVDFYTNWCGWCKRMDKNTYEDEEVKKLLNESYVTIKVNAESKEEVQVDGQKMTEKDLARKFSVRSYPTIWFLKHSSDRIAPYYGYADAQNFLKVLTFIKDDLYDKMSFEEYLKNQDKNKDEKKK
jgi:thioredoxin-related protein